MIGWIKKWLCRPVWEDGILDGRPARRNIKTRHVEFLLWPKGHARSPDEDFWIDFDPSWWPQFQPTTPKGQP